MEKLADVMDRAEQAVTRLEAAGGLMAVRRMRAEIIEDLDSFTEAQISAKQRDAITDKIDDVIAVLERVRSDTTNQLTWGDKLEMAQSLISLGPVALRAARMMDAAELGDRGIA